MPGSLERQSHGPVKSGALSRGVWLCPPLLPPYRGQGNAVATTFTPPRGSREVLSRYLYRFGCPPRSLLMPERREVPACPHSHSITPVCSVWSRYRDQLSALGSGVADHSEKLMQRHRQVLRGIDVRKPAAPAETLVLPKVAGIRQDFNFI